MGNEKPPVDFDDTLDHLKDTPIPRNFWVYFNLSQKL